jgi:hypothetical protein
MSATKTPPGQIGAEPSSADREVASQRLLVVTPTHNEADHIERVVGAVAAQSRPPDEWIVLDDNSTDGTGELLRALAGRVPFMRVAKLDGDVELPPDYFEKMLERLDDDPSLGIVCGDLIEPAPAGWQRLAIPPHHVHGALKLYSAECLNAIGGVREVLGWDTIDETYARMRGFRTRSYSDVVAKHLRPSGTASGALRGRARHGRCAWIAHFGLGWVAMRSVKVGLRMRPRGLSGAAFLGGYLYAAMIRVPRVEDREFRRFVRSELRSRMRAALRRRAG